MKLFLLKVLKEPLVHFLFLALVLFQIYGFLNKNEEESTIVINEGSIDQLYKRFTYMWQRDPSQEELALIVRAYAMNEIYAQEARNLGLDKGDGVINNRLKSKVQDMISNAVFLSDITEEELKTFYEENKERYAGDSFFSFKQVSLDVNSGKDIKKQIEEQNKRIADGLEPQGITTSLEPSYTNMRGDRVAKTLGNDFLNALNKKAELNKWSGPFQSGIGVHYVYLSKRSLASVAEFEDVKEKVKDDYIQQKTSEAILEYERMMLEQYTVELPDGELSEKD